MTGLSQHDIDLSIQHQHQEEFTEQVNALFREEQLGFEMREGKIEKVGSGFIDALYFCIISLFSTYYFALQVAQSHINITFKILNSFA